MSASLRTSVGLRSPTIRASQLAATAAVALTLGAASAAHTTPPRNAASADARGAALLSAVDAPPVPDAPLDPTWVAARAVARSARLRALDARVAAASARAEADGALEDPMLMVRVWDVPWDIVSRAPGQTMLMARQVVPLSGSRDRRRELAATSVVEARIERDVTEHAVRMEAELAFVALAEAVDRRRAAAALLDAAMALAALAEARAPAAPVPALDASIARTTVARSQAELRAAEAVVEARRTELAALLDLADPASLPEPAPLLERAALPEASRPEPLATLLARARRDRPEARYAEAVRARARALSALATASDGPLLDLGAGIMVMPHGAGFMLDAGITLPVWRAPRRARHAEAAAVAAEADAVEEAWTLALTREIASALAALRAATVRRDALRDELLPALEARRAAMLAVYAVQGAGTATSGPGAATLEAVVEGLREEASARAELATALADIARAEVWLAHAIGAHGASWTEVGQPHGPDYRDAGVREDARSMEQRGPAATGRAEPDEEARP